VGVLKGKSNFNLRSLKENPYYLESEPKLMKTSWIDVRCFL